MTQSTEPQGGADQTAFNNELRGALFRNDKGSNPSRPDYRGRCQIDGTAYRISGWVRQSRAGQTFLSLAFTADPTAPAPDPGPERTTEPDADPMPF